MSSKMPRVVDEEFEEQFVHCQICTHKFDQVERVPKILPCYHTFCLPCLDKISGTRQGRLSCPMCNQEFRAAGTCKDLPTDHNKVSLLDWMDKAASNPETSSPQTDTKPQNTCSKHDGEKTFFVCETCFVPVCHQCTVLDHNKSDGHVIAEIKNILSKQDDRMRSVEKNSKDILQKLGIKLDDLKKSLRALDQSKTQHTEKIKQRFTDFRHRLDKYEKDLISRECQRNKLQTDLLQAQHDSLYEQVTQFQKLFDDFQNEDDVTNLLLTVNKLSQQENHLQQMATTDTIGIDGVTQRNEKAFQSDMRSAESIWSELNLEDIERQIDRLSSTQTKGEQLPRGWASMQERETLKIVCLAPDSKEYKMVEQKFRDGGANERIKQIERVQNTALYYQYAAKRRELEMCNPKGHENEKTLYHPPEADSLDMINNYGFHRSYFRAINERMLGDGIYFAVQSGYSVKYAKADFSGTRKVYQARVLVGESTVTSSGAKYAPMKPGSKVPYDSGTDSANAIYVIFHDAQAYPEYLISF